MHVTRVRWNPVNEERPISVRFTPVSPRPPKAPEVPEVVADEPDEPQAKVVRGPRRKGPRASTDGVDVK